MENSELMLRSSVGLPPTTWNEVIEAVESSLAPGTQAVYASHWRKWQQWCVANDAPSLPTTPEHLALYLKARAKVHVMSTVHTAAAAIGCYHLLAGYESPARHEGVKRELRGLARQHRRASQQVQGLTAIKLAMIAATSNIPRDRESEAQAQLRGTMDLAMIGMMRDSLLRRSEAAALTWDDLTEWEDGSGRLYISHSKADQEGKGDVTFVSPQTMRWVRQMREMAGDRETIIGLCPHQIGRRIVSAAAAAGLSGRYGGHSPRVGMAQDLAEAQTGLPNMLQVGRWKRAETLLLYIRNIAAGQNAVADWYARRGE